MEARAGAPRPDPVAAALTKEVEEAEARLLALCHSRPGEWEHAHTLKAHARGDRSDGATNMALRRLIDAGELETRGSNVKLAELDRNCLSYWFPRIAAAGLPVPTTLMIETKGDRDPISLLDGRTPVGWEETVNAIATAAETVGTPAFLRTGHGSGKHDWSSTCFLEDSKRETIERHILALVEWSATAGVFGLPTQTWVVRKMLDTKPAFRCDGYGGLPITPEVRVFADGTGMIEGLQPYWPPEAVETGRPDEPDWRHRLDQISRLERIDHYRVINLALKAARAVGGRWSIDLIQDTSSKWWITDMALAVDSYRAPVAA